MILSYWSLLLMKLNNANKTNCIKYTQTLYGAGAIFMMHT